ncbi:MAG: ABC transporter permease [Candidatus Cloacimonetes bacterium]|nr:ABC transporter permease [Candidatus Cloacimonadota bacterium]
MKTLDISIFSLFLCFLLLLISFFTSFLLKLSLSKTILISVSRMTIQLILIGIFLKYLFKWNNPFINLTWLMVMIISAVYTVISTSKVKFTKFFPYAFVSFTFSTFLVILYVNKFVIRIDNIFDAKYIVVLSGMLLGNTLRSNIIGINIFYKNLRKESDQYFYILSLGATQFEAILPYLRESMLSALKPTLATMATMGLVALPGMMTGTILGGASPITAIKYQIVIMIAIFVCTNISVLLTILLTLKVSFNNYGILRNDFFRDK